MALRGGAHHGQVHPTRKRHAARRRRRRRHPASLCPEERSRAQRAEVRLRACAMRRLHRADRRQGRALVRHADLLGERSRGDDRGPGHGEEAASDPEGVHRGAGLPVRLLRQCHGDVGESAPRQQSAPDERGHSQGAERASMPLRLAQPNRASGAKGGEGDELMTSRRDFLKGAGGLGIAFALPAAAQTRLPGSLSNNRMLNAWLRIDPEGTVTIFTGKIELGQGIGTALAQIAADELDVDMKRIKLVHGDTALTPNEGQTAGSLSVQDSGTAVRFACAEAREILLSAAATKLGTSQLSVVDGTINGGLSYWSLAGESDLKKEATGNAKPKTATAQKWVGKSAPRRDIPKKFTGGAAYVQDIRLPGMLFGRLVRPPSPGAKLVTVDEAAVRRMPGIVAVVRDGEFLGVAAEREEQAIKARAALANRAQWKEIATLPPSGAALYEHMERIGGPAQTVLEKGSPTRNKIQARYTRPFQLHGSIGPSCALAQWTDGKLRVWTHSQGVYPLRNDLAQVFGIDAKDIRCTHAEGAGCYGHNGADDVALDAALLARATNGRPVKLQWMREDEFMWEPYGSAMVLKLGASLDAKGNVASWTHELWSHPHSTRPGTSKGAFTLAARHLGTPVGHAPVGDVPQPSGGADRNSIPLYEFPNVKVTKHFIVDSPLRTSALRTLGGYANVFALESFMDELAASAGVDPVEYRLRHMKDPRARAVIAETANRAGWRP